MRGLRWLIIINVVLIFFIHGIPAVSADSGGFWDGDDFITNVELCPKADNPKFRGSEYEQSQCYNYFAIDNKSREICYRGYDQHLAMECVSEFAIIANNPSYCEELLTKSLAVSKEGRIFNRKNQRNACITKVAIATGDAKLCELITGENYNKILYESCLNQVSSVFMDQGIETKDVAQCSKAKDPKYCYSKMGFQLSSFFQDKGYFSYWIITLLIWLISIIIAGLIFYAYARQIIDHFQHARKMRVKNIVGLILLSILLILIILSIIARTGHPPLATIIYLYLGPTGLFIPLFFFIILGAFRKRK